MSDELRARVAARSDEELLATCTTDAADYTDDAIVLAREELARRGHDVSKLVAATTPPPPDPVAERRRLGAGTIVAALVVTMFSAPFLSGAPHVVQVLVTSGILSLAFVGARSLVGR